MPTARTEISAELLDGRIYVVGGSDQEDALDTAEVFDPSENRWSSISPLAIALDHAGLTSHDGKLYLVGGFTTSSEGRHPTNILLTHDPQEDKWIEEAPMSNARAGLSADFIDGILYAIGGSTSDNEGQLNITQYKPGL